MRQAVGLVPDLNPRQIGRVLLFRRLAVIAVIIASYFALSRFVDLESLAAGVFSLPSNVLLQLLVLLFCAELVKGVRWAYFLRASELDIRPLDGMTSYLGAQAATALPGGSVLALRLAEEHGRARMHQAAAGLVGLNIADMFALSLISMAAIVATHEHHAQFLLPLAVLGLATAGVIVIRSQRLAHWLSGVLNRWRLTRRFAPQEDDFRQHAALVMRRRVLMLGIAFSVVTTLISAGVLLTLVNGMTERGVSPLEAIYIHAVSGVTGNVVPASGGFGVTDASQAGLLNFIGIGLGRATFIALVYRTVGLLFRSVLGAFVLLVRYPNVLLGQMPLVGRRTAPRRHARTLPHPRPHAVASVTESLAAPIPAQIETPGG